MILSAGNKVAGTGRTCSNSNAVSCDQKTMCNSRMFAITRKKWTCSARLFLVAVHGKFFPGLIHHRFQHVVPRNQFRFCSIAETEEQKNCNEHRVCSHSQFLFSVIFSLTGNCTVGGLIGRICNRLFLESSNPRLRCPITIYQTPRSLADRILENLAAYSDYPSEIPIFAGQSECVEAMVALSSGTINGLIVDAGKNLDTQKLKKV
jgi:hypothetical protein